MKDFLEIVRDAGPAVTLIFFFLSLIALGIIYRKYSTIREAERNRVAEHLEGFGRRVADIEKADERRETRLAQGAERFGELAKATDNNREALLEVSRTFVRASDCERCQDRQQKAADRFERTLEKIGETQVQTAHAYSKLEATVISRIDALPRLIAAQSVVPASPEAPR